MFIRKVPCLVALAALALGAGGAAQAVPLSDLVGGDTITVGNLLFDNFNYSSEGDAPSSSDINVVAIVDVDGNAGIRFQGGFGDIPGGEATEATIGYTVSVIDPEVSLIVDAHLLGNPNIFGVGDGLVEVKEFLSGTDCGGAACELEITDNNDGNPTLHDEVAFDGVESITVRKQVEVTTGVDPLGFAQITFIDQTFSEGQPPVPEPTALGLGGLAAALVAARRRRS